MKVFVLHHPTLVDRKKYLEQQLSNNSILAEWIEEYSPELIQVPINEKQITVREYSLYLKHKKALNTFLEDSIANYCLILEDDALLFTGFSVFLKKCLHEFKELNGDVLMLGTASFPHLSLKPNNITPNKHVYYDPTYTTRCTHAILYTKLAAKTTIKELNNNFKPYDHKLNEIIVNNKLRTCWVEPGIYQGSRPDTPTTHLWHTSIR